MAFYRHTTFRIKSTQISFFIIDHRYICINTTTLNHTKYERKYYCLFISISRICIIEQVKKVRCILGAKTYLELSEEG